MILYIWGIVRPFFCRNKSFGSFSSSAKKCSSHRTRERADKKEESLCQSYPAGQKSSMRLKLNPLPNPTIPLPFLSSALAKSNKDPSPGSSFCVTQAQIPPLLVSHNYSRKKLLIFLSRVSGAWAGKIPGGSLSASCVSAGFSQFLSINWDDQKNAVCTGETGESGRRWKL